MPQVNSQDTTQMDLNNLSTQEAVGVVQDKVAGWLETTIAMIPNFVVALVVLGLFLLLAKLARGGVRRFGNRIHSNKAILDLLASILYILVIGTGLFVALSVLNLDRTVTSLLAGAGIIGVALGFAFQDTAANFLAGIIIAFRKPYRVGDIVESQDYMGTVDQINLRTTVLITFQGQEVLIPNRLVINDPIVNFTKTGKRRIDLDVGISYGDDLEKVKRVVLKALEGADFIAKDTETKLDYCEFGNSSINFTVRFWITYPEQPSFLEARSGAVMLIKKAFDENDITIPFPIRTLDFGIKGGEKLSEMEIPIKSNGVAND